MKTPMLFAASARLWIAAIPVLTAMLIITFVTKAYNLTASMGGSRTYNPRHNALNQNQVGRLMGLVFVIGLLTFASILESFGQEQANQPADEKKQLVFENSQTKQKTVIVVGDVLQLNLKRPEFEFTGRIISLTDSTITVTFKQSPGFQSIRIDNIQSLSVYSRGSLYRLDSFEKKDSSIYRIETNNDNEFIGKIIAQDLDVVRLKTDQLGEISIRKSDIKEIEEINPQKIIGGALWFDNPQASRYFWQPNGYGVKKGEAYYQNVWILFNQLTVGVSDNFSLGVGMVPLFLFGGGPTPVWANAKFSIPVQPGKLNLGAGILSGAVIGAEGESGSKNGFGIAYGMTTFGSRDKNFSIGLGYGYSAGKWAHHPTVSFSGMVRTGPRSYFLTENYYIGSSENNLVLISVGGRKIVRRTGIDFGLFMPFSQGQSMMIAIPWLGITVPLRK